MLTENQKKLYNATVKIIYRDKTKMVFRVHADAVKIKYVGGQYGALGLLSDHERIDQAGTSSIKDPALIKRAYSLSSSILDENNSLIDSSQTDYYEFYIDLVLASEDEKPRLSSRLFTLKDADRLFLGPKIVGHYTLKTMLPGKKVLFMATTTGESPHNSMIAELLGQNNLSQITHVVVGKKGWVSAYHSIHEKLMKKYPNYRYLPITIEDGYQSLESSVQVWLKDGKKAQGQLGWPLISEETHVFLCGDPLMIGAPAKLGAWSYEYPQYGLMRILEQSGFKAATRFQTGNISYESYW